ncbi:MAG: carbohydrate-binding protein, partial [Clostridia bacterium]|nr:carbohydrate-binding protein [Clostridia bacterium]
NGVYYLNAHGSEYATADNIYGPYTYRGNFCHDAYVDHGTFFTYHNQLYFTYGVPENWGAEKVDPFYRTTKIIYAHYKDNGDICIDEFIQDVGVGQYDATWPAIKGEWYFAASDGVYKKENADGFEMRGLGDGSYLYYQNVNNLRQNAKLFVRGICGQSPCQIEVREGSPFGAVLGCCKIQPNGEGIREYEIPLTNSHGTHSLCFVFRGEGEDLFIFDDFRFEQVKA